MNKDSKYVSYLSTLLQDRPNGAGNARVAACIVYKKRVLGFGFNQEKSSPFQKEYGKNEKAIYLHAENDAITKAIRRVDPEIFRKSTIYIVRMKKDKPRGVNILGNSCPCSGCHEVLTKKYNFKRVVFITENGLLAELV